MRSLRLALAALFAAAVLPAPAYAGEIVPGSPKAALAQQLIAREKASWEMYARKDAAALTAMTSDDFADLYSGGEVVGRKRWLADMMGVEVTRHELSGFHAFDLADDVILLTYDGKAWARTPKGDAYNHAGVTSAWALRGGRWLNVFYGETALDPGSVISGGVPTGAGQAGKP